MAILGAEGRLTLKRETPEPITISSDPSNPNPTGYQIDSADFWSGDQVQLNAPGGLPFLQTATQSMSPGGQGIWSDSPWAYAEGWEGILPSDAVWADAPAFPWADAQPAVTEMTAYLHVDSLNRVSFHSARTDAINGNPATALATSNVDFGSIVMTGLDADWRYACEIKNWSLELDSPSVDTTGIGVKFGESVKSLVTGGGEIGYIVERRSGDGTEDPIALLRLLLLTERGCKASAQFWMVQDRSADLCSGVPAGSLYYESDLFIVGTSLNLVPTEVVGGAARFVTTGEIRLKVGVQ